MLMLHVRYAACCFAGSGACWFYFVGLLLAESFLGMVVFCAFWWFSWFVWLGFLFCYVVLMYCLV